ncbi:V-type ATPase, C subunit [Blastomyces silverae]|uniref:V-type ATPase, C subunit n=1 Tax=Blastomyces silverae TaxID=2060906 RepID=A0A0H1BVN4_9EURO|nr:V-type ATPase, C subunit [Blastomyces silverae]
MADSELAPKFAPFFGMAGIASAMIFGSLGAAYGTAKSGIGIAGVGTFRSDLIMKAGLIHNTYFDFWSGMLRSFLY